MKRLVGALLVWCLPTAMLGQLQTGEITIIRSDDRSIVFEYRPQYIPPRTITQGNQVYTIYDFVGSTPTYSGTFIGTPDLRYRAFPLGFPSETGNSAQVLSSDYEDIPNVTVAPIPTLKLKEQLLETDSYRMNIDVYNEGVFLPARVAELPPVGKVRSMLLGSVRIFPVQYLPSTRTVRRYKRVQIEVVYGNSQGQRVQNQDDQMFKNALLNYNVARSWKFGIPRGLAKVTANSLLASGKWYRLTVDTEGMYRIDSQFLTAAGIDVSAIDPRTIKIYGNGGAELPEDVSLPRPDDLVENAIYVEGESDGQLNANDYIVFYGKSTRGWRYNGASRLLSHYVHHYTEQNYYWLTFGGTNGKRMQSQPSLADPPTIVPDRFTDGVFVEEEKENLLRSGKDWYGQKLGGGGSFTYANLLPDVVGGDQIRYRYTLVARSDVPPFFNVKEGSTLIGSHALGTVFYGSFSTYATAGTFETLGSSTLSDNTSRLNFAYNAPSTSDGWIDWIEIFFPRRFYAVNNYLRFRSPDATGTVEYQLERFTTSPMVFDVTTQENVRRISGAVATFRASQQAGNVSEYCAGDPAGFKRPAGIQLIPNQNLRGYGSGADPAGADFIILTSPEFRPAADRLKAFREQPAHGNLRTLVVDVAQIYNEFSGGLPDVTAIRDFLKYAYANWTRSPRFVLFFGGGSYDYKGLLGFRSSFVPTWQSPESRDDINSSGNDTFFAAFGVTDAPSVVTGRISSRTLAEANTVVDKIIGYEENSAHDPWKMRMLFIGDDGWTTDGGESDGTIHSQDAETLAESFYAPSLRYTPDVFERKKIYIADYPTAYTAQGRRKPGAYQAIIDQVNQGVLIFNYAGHGNPSLLAHENIFNVQTSIPELTNASKLAVFFLATCNFSQFDDPKAYTGSEVLMNKPDGGAVGVVSATRKVYQSQNAYLHQQVLRQLFSIDQFGRVVAERPATAMFIFKATVSNDPNDQKYFYMGDPTMRLQFPSSYVSIDSVNHQPVDSTNGVPRLSAIGLKALSRVVVTGTIRDQNDRVDTTASGDLTLVINDASRQLTIANFPPGGSWSYLATGGTIYRGQNSVHHGRFNATFVVPKDISYSDSTTRGRIVGYFSNGSNDGGGYTANVRVGGADSSVASSDSRGPVMNLYVQSRSFRAGDVVSSSPMLYIDMVDSNGINTSASGLGHRIEAWVNNSSQSKDLTEFYSSKHDSYQEGTVQYQLQDLPQGKNLLRVRAFDTFNNASTAETYFDVASTDQLTISDVMNFPNPFSSGTTFTFKQNQVNPLNITIKVYTLAGRLIQTLDALSSGDLFVRVPWDGRDRDGDILANGVYLYKVIAKTVDGRSSSEALGKLSIIR